MLLCCVPEQSEARRARMHALLSGGINWNRFIPLMIQNGVKPLVAARLLVSDSRALLPASIEPEFALTPMAIAMRNQHQAERLVEIMDSLQGEGIPALAMKGVVLAVAAYHDLSLRTFGDLDLLISHGDVIRAVATLELLGYKSNSWRADAFASGFFADTSIDLNGVGVVLDLHWSLGADYFPFAPDNAAAFRNAIEIDLGGRRVRTLSPLDSVLFQAFHAAKHGWARLQQICDFAWMLAAAGEIDFDALLQQAEAVGARTILLTGVALAAALLEAEFPPPLLNLAAREPRVAGLRTTIERRLFVRRSEGMFTEWPVAIRCIDATGGRTRYLLSRLLWPRLSDAALLRLPRVLFPLYYLARPALLAIKHAGPLMGARVKRATMIS
jgi:Uncharacterised nucleotidyltransferase